MTKPMTDAAPPNITGPGSFDEVAEPEANVMPDSSSVDTDVTDALPAGSALGRPAADPAVLVGSDAAEAVPTTGATRGRYQRPLFRIRGDIGPGWRLGLGVAGVAAIFVVWILMSMGDNANNAIIPTPAATIQALGDLWSDGTLQTDLAASMQRIAIGYAISVAVGIVVGIGIGTFASGRVVPGAPVRLPALRARHRADPVVPVVVRNRREPEDLADRRRDGVLQHPDGGRRRPCGPPRAAQRVVHAGCGPGHDPPAGGPAALGAGDHRRRSDQPRRGMVDARRRRAPGGQVRPGVRDRAGRSASVPST